MSVSTLSMPALHMNKPLFNISPPVININALDISTKAATAPTTSRIDKLLPKAEAPLDLSEGSIIKPQLLTPEDRKTKKRSCSAQQILFEMMQNSQKLILEEETQPKIDAVRRKLDNIKEARHQLDVKLKEEADKAAVWEKRKNIAQNFLSVAGILIGGASIFSGSFLSGGALLAGGLGGLIGSILGNFDVDPKITGGIALASGVVSFLGGMGSAFFNPSGALNTAMSLVQMTTGVLNGGVSTYGYHMQAQVATYQAENTKIETQEKLLYEKIQGALTGFKGVVDSSSKTMKALAKAGKRYSRATAKMMS